MSIATITPLSHDDPDVPGLYVTDGERLYRLIGADEPRNYYIGVEDCGTLEIFHVDGQELRGWGLTPVCPRAMAMAA